MAGVERSQGTGAALLGLALHTSIVLSTGAVVEVTIFAMVTTSLYLLFFDLQPLPLPGAWSRPLHPATIRLPW